MSLPESDRSWREQCQSNVGHRPMVDVTDMIRRGESVCGAVSLASLQRLAQDLPDQPLSLVLRVGLGHRIWTRLAWFGTSSAAQARPGGETGYG